MNVTFYFDPICPFCWITSRWLLTVAEHRDLTIDWQPFSLALKNNQLALQSKESNYAAPHRSSHRVLRVIAAAEKHGAQPIDLYTSFGIQFHVAGNEYTDEVIQQVLAEHTLPAELLQTADNTEFDTAIQASVQGAIDIVGSDIGVPTIIFQTADNTKTGYFGPVLQTLPELDEALTIWDGLSKLATSTSFYELKRSRPEGQPDVFSTARC